MPVTVKLSRLFYERFGDEIANELADWLNHVDAAATRQLRDLNAQNFRQFEAVLNAKAREIEAKIEALGSAIDVKLEGLRSEMDVKLEGLRSEIGIKLEGLRSEIGIKVDGLSARFEQRLAENKEELMTEIGSLRTDIYAFKTELLNGCFSSGSALSPRSSRSVICCGAVSSWHGSGLKARLGPNCKS